MIPATRFSQCIILILAAMATGSAAVALCCLPVQMAQVATADDRGQSPESDFPKIFNTESLDTPRLSAGQAASEMRVPDGFTVQVFAAEPDVHQPIGIATDARGRLWVAENYTYAESGVNYDMRLKDRIVILEDTDGDGQSDKRTVFWDQAEKLTSVEIGYGGVWALCAPNLLFLPDRDGDDVMDGPPEVVLDGWDADAVRHNIVNGLRWGPDGWLYGRHGILATSFVAAPGTAEEQRTPINCGVWRYHPTRGSFEVVARGTTNPWGMDWNAEGELFMINTVIGHLWHVFPGARYRRMYGEHFNPHLYEVMEQTADHFHWDTAEAWSDLKKTGMSRTTDAAGGGHAHSGMLIYQGDNWPAEYRGDVFALNLHGRRMNRDHLERTGSGYVAHHGPDFLQATDPWFRAVELIQGPAGEVLIADWSDVGECHENDGVHRTSGRIYRVVSNDARSPRPRNFDQLSNEQLISQLFATDSWPARQALHQLYQRTAAGQDLSSVRERLLPELAAREHIRALRALWGLNATGGCRPGLLAKLLQHPHESIRVWAIRLMLESDALDESQAELLTERAGTETSGIVRLYLAAALAEMPLPKRPDLAAALLKRAPEDRQLELLLWYGLEPSVAGHPAEAIQLAATCPAEMLPRFISRRVTSASLRNSEQLIPLIEAIATATSADRQAAMLLGMTEAMRGWRTATAPSNWEQARTRLRASEDERVGRLAQEVSVVYGDGRALDELKQLAANRGESLDSRRNAIRVLVESRAEGLAPLLQQLLNDRDMAGEAVRGLAAYQHPETARLILSHFNRMYTHDRREAISTLTVRVETARELLDAIDAGQISREYVTAFQIRQMSSLGDDTIKTRLTQLWPELRLTTADQKRRIEELRAALTEPVLAAGNRSHGRALFTKSCANCHVLFGTGGKIGPDLTGSQRSNLNYLLENIVAPSLQVAESYRITTFVLDDGRVLNGVVKQANAETTSIQTPTELLVIRNDEIEDSKKTTLSMMPERQLDFMTADEVRDLIAYLMSPEQVPTMIGD